MEPVMDQGQEIAPTRNKKKLELWRDELMNKNLFVTMSILALLLSTGIASAGLIQHQQPEATPMNGEPLWQRIRNQINDMLGICDGDCQTELVELTGTLSFDGVYYHVDTVEVHFGPVWYMTSTQAPEDYDIDGTLELINDEIEGLIGSTITLDGYYQSEQWFSVFSINTLFYREIGRPIWSGGN